MRWFSVSATKSFPRATASPCGEWNVARSAGPSSRPRSPVPIARSSVERPEAIGPRRDHDAVVPGVGDEQPPLGRGHARLGQHLAGEREPRGRAHGRVGHDRRRRRGQRARPRVLLEQRGDRLLELVAAPLARHRGDDGAGRVHQHARRPRARPVGPPQPHVLVHHHRVPDAVALHRGADAAAVGLVVELGRVHADHDERAAGEDALEVLEVGQDVHAVDAAVGPEVEQHDLALELLREAQRPVGVEPGETRIQFGGVDGGAHGRPPRVGGEPTTFPGPRANRRRRVSARRAPRRPARPGTRPAARAGPRRRAARPRRAGPQRLRALADAQDLVERRALRRA